MEKFSTMDSVVAITVFISMIRPRHMYPANYTRKLHADGKVHEVVINENGHRLNGLHQFIYIVQNENEMKSLFSEFKCINIGYSDMCMLHLTSTFHWIYIGRNF